jgi:hypothetical protein
MPTGRCRPVGRVVHGQGGCDHRRGHLGLHYLVDGGKQGVLARKVVIEGPAGHSHPLDDALDRGSGIAALGEELAGDVYQLLAGRLCLALSQPLDSHSATRTERTWLFSRQAVTIQRREAAA